MAASNPSSPELQTPNVARAEPRPGLGGGTGLGKGTARLRRLARLRRRFGWLALALPPLLVLVADAELRGGRLLALPPRYLASYGAALAESALLWGLLLFAASARRGWLRWVCAALFVGMGTASVGCQVYFHRQYATYLNLDATLFGTDLSASVFGQLRADDRNFLTSVLPPLLLTVALVGLARLALRPRREPLGRVARWTAPLAAGAVFLIPCSYRTVQASTPDVIYFHAMGGLMKKLFLGGSTVQVRPGLRTPPALPALQAHRLHGDRARNVLFILTESVRADASCSAPAASCPGTPEVNALLPRRLPLVQMRSNTSTTAIELAVLWSGLPPTSSREALHVAPLLFDYAKAAGIDDAYWTSHHMLFANSRLFVQDLPTSHQCGATELDPLADIDLGARDELLTARVERDLPELKEPFFGVVHYGNTHVPYRLDPADAPFQPSLESKSPSDNEAYHNYYRNAVHLQDRTIAELVRFVRASPAGARTVLVFTSDHGEAFLEHGQLGHTGAVLDEELRVPFWIDAPPGTLTAVEEAALASAKDELRFHTDVTPTVLDLMGLWDAPELASLRASMVGGSLLRARPAAPAPVALTNCSGIWGCVFRNWGMMRGPLKLEAREWDGRWHCYDVLADPREASDLGAAACGDLAALAEAAHGGLPSAR